MDSLDFSGELVSHYLFSSVLGAGASGSVHKAVDITMEKSPTYAIKCVRKKSDSTRLSRQRTEVVNHDSVTLCPNVLTLCDTFEMDDYIFLVLPFCEKDMFKAIFKERIYWRNDALIRKAFTEILDGILSCHKTGIFHRDLKPENIMCNAKGTSIKIGDFGLSTTRRRCGDGGCGTVPYTSPECLYKNKFCYDAALADIWSLGIILFNMVTCACPWEEAHPKDRDFTAFISNPDQFLQTYRISEPLSVLLHRIWNPTPAKRMSIPAIRQAIQDMDTFYQPRRSSHAASRPLKEQEVLVDSEQTCVNVAPVADEKERDKEKGPRVSVDALEVMFSRLEVTLYDLVQ
ncbi:kinase-like domain-containing protein [Boletus edulis]|uniref:Kinase-like domain-containing protein n=2 Tax=Boletus edulis BED1 TaxID=1328754 RepID=A0AAD4BQ17_BOLED|nr:kinase-like domain-containing protein [Boletus edulis]KAF8436833.1 kinase-like domain-containing protein [Boletus edulis BED1]